jgi:hypothetical protein
MAGDKPKAHRKRQAGAKAKKKQAKKDVGCVYVLYVPVLNSSSIGKIWTEKQECSVCISFEAF